MTYSLRKHVKNCMKTQPETPPTQGRRNQPASETETAESRIPTVLLVRYLKRETGRKNNGKRTPQGTLIVKTDKFLTNIEEKTQNSRQTGDIALLEPIERLLRALQCCHPYCPDILR